MHTNTNNKRRPNTNSSQPRHNNNNNNNNRPRRFSNNGRVGGEEDSANIARTRRNATQSREKYQNLAHDAMSSGDRVLAENYLQHADHYFRILLALPPEETRQPQPQQRTPYRNHQAGSEDATANSGSNEVVANEESTDTSHRVETQAAESALPSFITQPLARNLAVNEVVSE